MKEEQLKLVNRATRFVEKRWNEAHFSLQMVWWLLYQANRNRRISIKLEQKTTKTKK